MISLIFPMCMIHSNHFLVDFRMQIIEDDHLKAWAFTKSKNVIQHENYRYEFSKYWGVSNCDALQFFHTRDVICCFFPYAFQVIILNVFFYLCSLRTRL